VYCRRVSNWVNVLKHLRTHTGACLQFLDHVRQLAGSHVGPSVGLLAHAGEEGGGGQPHVQPAGRPRRGQQAQQGEGCRRREHLQVPTLCQLLAQVRGYVLDFFVSKRYRGGTLRMVQNLSIQYGDFPVRNGGFTSRTLVQWVWVRSILNDGCLLLKERQK